MLEISLSRRAGGGVLAHTHGGVALVDLAHLSLLAVVVQAEICGQKTVSLSGNSSQTDAMTQHRHKQPSPFLWPEEN